MFELGHHRSRKGLDRRLSELHAELVRFREGPARRLAPSDFEGLRWPGLKSVPEEHPKTDAPPEQPQAGWQPG